MGGKHNQAQRTKNNARPSNSGRTAELLGASIPNFVGFSALKESGTVLPGFSLATDENNSPIDCSNFQLALKKMNKKDSTTKLKALQEFTELTKGANVEAVKAVLPFWPRMYCVLATDTEPRVREATHIAHQQVVLKVKKNLAPFLKQLAGAWFTSQYDTYPPAATAATKSFEDAFPQNKVEDAIIFCQEEILFYICDNLTEQTRESVGTQKMTPEDAEAKYQVIVTASLHGYTLYLTKVSVENIKAATALNLKILSHKKFWDLPKSKVVSFKAAWFNTITAVCHKAPFLLKDEAKRVTETVFGNFNESEPTVLPFVWEAAILILKSELEWRKYTNVQKTILPKLWKVLKEGGYGNARTIYPCLLPLVSQLCNILDIKDFTRTFFENLRYGIKLKLLQSRLNLSAAAEAFIECLQYVIKISESDLEFCENLISSQLFSLLQDSLTNTKVSNRSLFNQITSIVQYWSRNRSSYGHYKKCIEVFLCNLDLLFTNILLTDAKTEGVLMHLAQNQIEFLLLLKTNAKIKKKVSFTTESDTNTSESDKSSLECDDNFYSNLVNDFIFRTCKNYVKITNERQTRELITCLVTLVDDFDNAKLFEHLNLELGNEGDSLVDIYNKLLLKWLLNDRLCCKSVVELVFSLLKYLKTEERVEIFNSFSKIANEECLGWCIGKSLSHPYNLDPVIQNWLYHECVEEFLTAIMEKELNETCTPELTLILKQAFAEKPNGELFINATTITKIIRLLRKCINDPTSYSGIIDKCISFASHVSDMIYTSSFKLKYGDELLLDMFNLSIKSNIDSDVLSTDTLWEVGVAWEDAMATLGANLETNDFKTLVWKCSDVMQKSLNDKTNCNIDSVINVITRLITNLSQSSHLLATDLVVCFFKRNFISEYTAILTNICMEAEYIRGNLVSSPKDSEQGQSIDFIISYFTWCDLFARVLIKPVKDEDSDDDEENTSNISNVFNKLELSEDLEDLLLQLLYSITLMTSYEENYKGVMHYHETYTILQSINDTVKVLVQNLNKNAQDKVEASLIKKVLQENELWCKTLYIYCSKFNIQNLKKIYTSVANKIAPEEKSKFLHLTLVFGPHIGYEQIERSLSPFETVVVSRTLIDFWHCDVQVAETFSNIGIIEEKKKELSIDWSNFSADQSFIEILRFNAVILEYQSNSVQFNRWDKILLSFITSLRQLSNTKANFQKLQYKSCCSALSDLFISITKYVETSRKVNVKNEWRDLFAPDIYKYLIDIWMYISSKLELTIISDISNVPFLKEFQKVISNLDYKFLHENKHKDLHKWPKILKQASTLLINKCNTLQLWGYEMLMVLVPILIDVDTASVSTNTPHEKGLIFEQFKTLLDYLEEVMLNMLLEFKLGEDSCCVEPFTDSYIYTHAYLLLWNVLLTLCNRSSTELQYQYTDWLKNTTLTNKLLDNLFKLIPLSVMEDTKWKIYEDWFTTAFNISSRSCCSSPHIERMVCRTYYMVLSELPSLVRQWWTTKESKTLQVVEKTTLRFVSPHLCNKQLTDIAQHENNFKNMEIKVHFNVREIVAVYTIDDSQQLSIVITLPINYPLIGPEVQMNKNLSNGSLLKIWYMQIKMSLLRQNGTIWNCLASLNNNLDKKFEGADECNICFAVFHPGTCQFAKLSCKTCKNKFHSACMFQWFSTSNKSTCPICRTLFY